MTTLTENKMANSSPVMPAARGLAAGVMSVPVMSAPPTVGGRSPIEGTVFADLVEDRRVAG